MDFVLTVIAGVLVLILFAALVWLWNKGKAYLDKVNALVSELKSLDAYVEDRVGVLKKAIDGTLESLRSVTNSLTQLTALFGQNAEVTKSMIDRLADLGQSLAEETAKLSEQVQADRQEIGRLRQAAAEAEPSVSTRINQLARNYAKGPVAQPDGTTPSDAPRGR